ncbi:MAG TPA: OB-fold domain-containing protein [Marmoricola sp.]|nr:OB-fold domain-containing protein [Marmoricola sp.]
MTEPHDGEGSRDHALIMARCEEMKARGETYPRLARDPVNQPMINNWLEAIGETDPRFTEGEAPPAMAQVWTMYGLDPRRPARDPLHGTMAVLDEAGYTSVLGTNSDQTYGRHLRLGEQVSVTTRLESVVGPKQTGVGEGYFVTTRSTWRVGEEEVGSMSFRVLKFRPGTGRPVVDRSRTVRPVLNRDNAFFFEGTRLGELRIQRCNACGTLRHPPGPVCPCCHGTDQGHVVASGRGTLHSWVVHHAPQLPGKQLPLTIALVELEEGVRMVGALEGDALEIGAPVEVVYEEIDDALTLAAWRPIGSAEPAVRSAETSADVEPALGVLPAWELPITPTLVVSTALATRDFQDVHHDRDLAVARGSRDIFLNILTTTGLVQRYVGEWAREAIGPGFVVRSCELRLGAPAHPGDTLRFVGTVADSAEEAEVVTVDVLGMVSVGEHVRARVMLATGVGEDS